MNKYEKEILENKNLEAPSEDVLKKAKANLPQQKNRKAINYKKIIAVVSTCAAVLIVLACIPLMVPAHKDHIFVSNSSLKCEQILSANEYSQNLLYFDNAETNKYTYNDTTVLLEQHTNIDGSVIVFLIRLNSNANNITYEKEEYYTQYLYTLNGTQQLTLSNIKVNWTNVDNNIYLFFYHENCIYYAKISENIYDWQNLLTNFLFNPKI